MSRLLTTAEIREIEAKAYERAVKTMEEHEMFGSDLNMARLHVNEWAVNLRQLNEMEKDQ